ncbi:hypothetical protein SporoP8_03445 [Sporosarcina ureae]|uniref:hypothetical protein n=1 Tax=Sporosarcina ureae TaxID=1571 RepID=UPI000A1662B3|nr:hypothetical protein [Sporosarcina ureae]ARJ38030.1 hypothetical protein SporoP8_03445 [Sporosarcina ureae]
MDERKLENKILWIMVLVLFSCVGILISGMYNGVVFSEFDKNLLGSLSTFAGSLAGASIAGYFSIKVFEKGLKNEQKKKDVNLLISKVLHLNNYLDISKRLYFQLKQFNYDWNKTQNSKLEGNIAQTDKNKIKDCNLALDLCREKYDVMMYYLEETQNKIDNINHINHEHIMDIEFRIFIKGHLALLDQIIDYFDMINGFEKITSYGIEYWSVLDLIGSIQRYLADYDEIERFYYENK